MFCRLVRQGTTPIIAGSPSSAQQGAPRWCTPLQSREWDMAAFQATDHAVVYSACGSLPHHTPPPTLETLGIPRTYPHQEESAHQTAPVLDDGDVPFVRLGEST